jgi:hypothetical protein
MKLRFAQTRGKPARMLVHTLGLLACLLMACSGEPNDKTVRQPVGPIRITPADVKVDANQVCRLKSNNQRFTGTLHIDHPDGNKSKKIEYKDGLADGPHRMWYRNDQLKGELMMIKGLPHGRQTEWYRNGNRKAERKWDEGKPVGALTEWTENGKQEWVTTFENGRALPRKIVRNDDLTLPEADRKYLWDTEHYGTLLGKFGFDALKAALAGRDRGKLLAFLTEDFEGELPGDEQPIVADLGLGNAYRLEVSKDNCRICDSNNFVDWVLKRLEAFKAAPDIKVSMITFAPADRAAIDGPWRGMCMLRLWGKRADGGLLEMHLYMELTLVHPSKKNLKAGRWIRSAALKRIKHAESSSPLMTDITAQTGLEPEALHDNWNLNPKRTLMNTGGIFFCDWNHDGYEDLMITDAALSLKFRLYRGVGEGRFEDVTKAIGLGDQPDRMGAFVDLDGDGWEDIVFISGRIFRNLKGKRFQDVTSRSNLRQAAGLERFVSTTKIAVADYDRDGRVDLYLFRGDSNPTKGSWIDGQIGSKAANKLVRNMGNWKFEDVTEATQTDGGRRSTFTSAWLDADNNGWPDIYVINEYGNGVLLLNQGPGKPFRARELIDRAADFGSMGLAAGDINNDGHIDLYVASMYSKAGSRVIGNLRQSAYRDKVMAKLRRMVAGSQLYRNLGDGKFEPIGKAMNVVDVGWAYGPTLGDLDNDGFLDIHAPCGFISRTRDKPDG